MGSVPNKYQCIYVDYIHFLLISISLNEEYPTSVVEILLHWGAAAVSKYIYTI